MDWVVYDVKFCLALYASLAFSQPPLAYNAPYLICVVLLKFTRLSVTFIFFPYLIFLLDINNC